MAVYKFSNVGGFGTYQRYNDFLAGNPTTPVITDFGAYFPLGEFTLASTQATITFSSIPQTYKHLQVRIMARTDRAGASVDPMLLRFNSDSGTNYSWHDFYGDGASVAAEAASTSTGIKFYRAAGATATASRFGIAVLDILDYTSTNKNKTVRYLGGIDQNGSGEVFVGSGAWLNNTNATTSLSITPFAGTNFVANSSFALYGVLA